MNARIEHLETSGTFSLDGETHQVDNNVWIVGDDQEVIVIDPAHDAEAVEKTVAGRRVAAILLTHAHDDHIGQVKDVQSRIGGDIHLNWEDRVLWEQVYTDGEPDVKVSDGDTFTVAGTTLKRCTPPATPPAPPATTRPSWKGAWSSAETHCSTGAPARPDAPTAASTPSLIPSARCSSPCLRTPRSRPATDPPPLWARRSPTWMRQ